MPRKTKLKLPKVDEPIEIAHKNDSDALVYTVAGGLLGNAIVPGIGGAVVGSLIGNWLGSSDSVSEGDKVSKIPVFYSFHFDNDVMRVQQVRNIGSIEGNPPTTPNQWEQLKRSGKGAVEKWIDDNMKYKRCVIVLIGSETASRPWVQREIEKAWNSGKALLGIYIHNLKCPRNGTSRKGSNPFDMLQLSDGRKLSLFVPCYDPNPMYAYQDISANILGWINHAIANKRNG